MNKSADWLPHKDGEFDAFVKNYVSKIVANPGRYGLTAAHATALQAAQVAWMTKYETHTTAHQAAKAAALDKDGAKDVLADLMREDTRISEADPTVTDEAREEAGMPVHDTQKTPAPAPTTRPVAEIGTKERLEHTLRIRDEGGKARAKPFGVKECQVWVKVGDPIPADLEDCKFVDAVSRFTCTVKYRGADAGKNAHYLLRWISKRGVPGPISEVHSAVIPG